MKVSATGLLLASLCGSAFAAPIDVDARVDVDVNTEVYGRGEKVNVDATVGQPLGANVNGVIDAREEDVNVAVNVGQTLDVAVDSALDTRDITSYLHANIDKVADASVNAPIDTRDVNGNVNGNVNVVVDATRVADDAVVDGTVNTPINLNLRDANRNVDVDVNENDLANLNIDVLRRSVLPEGNVESTVAKAGNTVTSATGVNTMNTANSLSPEANQQLEDTVDSIVGGATGAAAPRGLTGVIIDGIVDTPINLNLRDVINDIDDDVYNDIVADLNVDVLRRSVLPENDVQSAVADVDNTAMSATGADATKALDGVQVDALKAQIQSTVQDAKKTLNTRDFNDDLQAQLKALDQAAAAIEQDLSDALDEISAN